MVVGSYVDDTIYLEPDVRGRGLAKELLLRWAEHRTLPLTQTSPTVDIHFYGERTVLRPRAIEAGLPVPVEVLVEYAHPQD